MRDAKLVFACVMVVLLANGAVLAQTPDPCNSTAGISLSGAPGLPVVMPTCPFGDGPSMIEMGWSINLTIKDGAGNPIPSIPPQDFWIDDCDPVNVLVVLCGGPTSSAADSPTDAAGHTTMSNTSPGISNFTGSIGCPTATPPCAPEPAGSARCTDGVYIIVQGVILRDPSTNCTTNKCYPINIRSFDLTGSGMVSSADLSTFAIGYVGGLGYPNPCTDFGGGGSLADLSTFALHFGPPGHRC